MSRSLDKNSSRSASFSNSPHLKIEKPTLLDTTLTYMRDRAPLTSKNLEQTKPRLRKIDRILKNLYEKHVEMKSHIEKLRIEKVKQEEKQFQKLPFSPRLTLSPRYQINGFFLERQEQKVKERDKCCQSKSKEKERQEMKECLFRPLLLANKTSQIYLKRRSQKLNTQKIDLSLQRDVHPSPHFQQIPQESMKKRKKTLKKGPNYEAMRDLIKFELSRAQLP